MKKSMLENNNDGVESHLENPISYNPEIRIIADDYEIPQLNKKRRISVLLPHGYEYSSKSYPVLYLHDGQNLFDGGGPYGNWAIDEKLSDLSKNGMGDIIVVAIDHAEEERVLEFSPFKETKWGKGDGKKYLKFLVETLKPQIDKNFRTLKEREFTGVGGSSMGGLISIYAGLRYPSVFGKLMIFSPSLWITPKIYFDAINFHQPYPTDIYLYAGGDESANMVGNVEKLKQILEEKNKEGTKVNIELHIDPDGKHEEWFWSREFPTALEYLYFRN
ncbi:alpha/beta hydrolase [Arenibacter sp. BSSL-BM3]|uniref:Alpha/beta hydrolase n=1 Tax=Arenibacter arenosicollis TaxID=2762274 RepID=A0ABR7QJX3_9FLAO|nr:alpha/beta hydrolase-fold protein [Arenibacter arenosicollis]MBC8767483.1 alpha/beta hydrolase [Arenibacter arenosicollis]